MKLLLVGAVAVGLVVLFVMLSPVQVWTLEILFTLANDGEMLFQPDMYVRQIPKASLLQGHSLSTTPRSYGWFGVTQVLLDINVTVLNVNGTTFFEGAFTLDSLGEHKIKMNREYSPENRTRDITLYIDAHLLVAFENGTDIDKSFHGNWNMTLPR